MASPMKPGAAPLPPAILSMLGSGGSKPPAHGNGSGHRPAEGASSGSGSGALSLAGGATGGSGDFSAGVNGAGLSSAPAPGFDDGWGRGGGLDLSTLIGGDGAFGLPPLSSSLHATLDNMRGDSGRQSIDSDNDRLTGAVLSELANSALNELLQQENTADDPLPLPPLPPAMPPAAAEIPFSELLSRATGAGRVGELGGATGAIGAAL